MSIRILITSILLAFSLWSNGVIAQSMCSCTITYQQLSNCCYEIYADFNGSDCATTVITDITFNTAFGANSAQILSFSGQSGISATNNATFGTLSVPPTSSFTTLPSYPAKIGEICMINGHPLTLVKSEAFAASGTLICQGFDELDGSCSPPQPPGPPSYFDKFYGGSDDDVPEDILVTSRGDFLVIANHGSSTNDRGTLSLIDPASSTPLHQYEAASSFLMSDVTEDEVTGEFYLVGFTNQRPGTTWLDNKTSIIKLDPNLNVIWEQRFNHIGRERFRHVYYNANATNTGPGIFVVGARNPTLPASGVDELIVYLFDNGGNQLWSRVINENDLEAYRGIVNVGFGSHVVLGNDAQGRGIIYEIQSTGSPGVRKRFNEPIDWYHGAELPSTNFLWVGQHFGSREAIIMQTDQSLNVLTTYRIPEIEKFEQVFESNGKFYTVGQLKNDPNKRNVIVRLTEDPNGLSYDLARRIEDGNTLRTMGKLNIYEGQPNYVGFAEALTIPTGYGGQDMHLAIYDPAISGTCVVNETLTLNQLTLTTSTINSLPQNLPPAVDAQTVTFSPLSYQCQPACQTQPLTCAADFTWLDRGCGDVDFTAAPTGQPTFSYDWELTGNTTINSNLANPSWNYGVSGTTVNVCLRITDAAGCSDRICKTVTVAADQTPPTITCRPDTSLTVAACDGGATLLFAPPVAVDGCDSMVTVVCNAPANDFYPCGRTTVTCVATDNNGNTSTCSYDVVITCACAATANAFMECTDTADHYFFEIELDDLTGATSCSNPTVTFSPANVIPSSLQTLYDPVRMKHYLRGYFDPAPGTRFPQNVTATISISCICANGQPYTCTHQVVIQTPCCKEAMLPDTALCKNATSVLIDVDFFGTVTDITQVNYWISPGPCGAAPITGLPYQVSRPYRPLELYPNLMPGNEYCIYAEVYLGPTEAPCTILRTAVSTVSLCDPFSISLQSETFCLAQGVQAMPSLLTITLPAPGSGCPYSDIRWYKNGNLIPGSVGQLSLQPDLITNNLSTTDCNAGDQYSIEVDGPCGIASASASISFDNLDADVGQLYLDPSEPLPFCPGEDASIRYDENCANAMLPPETWRWSSRTASTSYATLTGSGPNNPLWNSNRLFEDTWYKVERKNGSCPIQDVELQIPVEDPLTITTFNVKALDACRETGARISVNFSGCPGGVCPCPVVVEYYFNDNLIHTATSTTGVDSYDYTTPASDVYCGNYYVILRQACCNQVIQSGIEEFGCPIDLAAAGNCYCCNNGETLLVQGFPINAPSGCTYQWYLWQAGAWVPIAGATATAYVPSGFGRFKLVQDCGGCIKEAEHIIRDCGCGAATGARDIASDIQFEVFPNPARDQVTVRFESIHHDAERLELRDMTGRLLNSWSAEGLTQRQLELYDVTAGTYILTLITSDLEVIAKRIVIE